MATRLDLWIARVIGNAVDHALAPGIHILEAHVLKPGHGFQRTGRERHGVLRNQIGGTQRLQGVEDLPRMGLELCLPHLAHRAHRDGGVILLALLHVRLAILAHHVVPHEHVHQSARLMRGKYLDVLFAGEDVVAAREQRGVQLRHEGNRRIAPHALQVRIGIGPET